MKDHPILMSGPMVKAILAGEKTQTRRVVTKRNSELGSGEWDWLALEDAWPDKLWGVTPGLKVPTSNAPPEHCPECVTRLYPRLGPGDRLYVRETWGFRGTVYHMGDEHQTVSIDYRADGAKREIQMPDATRHDWMPKQPEQPVGMDQSEYNDVLWAWWKKWRASIHMPKWASRLWLEVKSVRVERLQDISAADAMAEGCGGVMEDRTRYFFPGQDIKYPTPGAAFLAFWDSLNEKRGYGRDTNPWVWVIEFKRISGP